MVNTKVVITSFTSDTNPVFYFEADNTDHSITCIKEPDSTGDFDNIRPIGKWNFELQDESKSQPFGSSGFGNANETLFEDAREGDSKELISNYLKELRDETGPYL